MTHPSDTILIDSPEGRILMALTSGPKTRHELSEMFAVSYRELVEVLGNLEVRKLITWVPTAHHYVLVETAVSAPPAITHRFQIGDRVTIPSLANVEVTVEERGIGEAQGQSYPQYRLHGLREWFPEIVLKAKPRRLVMPDGKRVWIEEGMWVREIEYAGALTEFRSMELTVRIPASFDNSGRLPFVEDLLALVREHTAIREG